MAIGSDILLGGAGSVVQGAFGLASAALQHKYEKENMAIQNQYQVEQWNRQNQYNDPSAVANRYSRAGINPQSALADGNSGAGIAGGLSSAPSPTTSANPGSISAPNFLDVRRIQNETHVAESQANKNNAEAELARSRTPTRGNLGDSHITYQQSITKLNDARANLASVQVATEQESQLKMRSERLLNDVIKEREQWNVAYNAATFDTRVAHQQQQFLQSVEDYNHSLKMNPLLREQAHSNAEYLYENALYAVVQKQLASKRIEMTEAQISHLAQQDEGIKNTIEVELKKLGFTGEMIPYEKAEKVINSVANVANSVSRIIMAVKSGSNNNGNTNFVNTIYDDAWATSPSNNF